MSKFYINEHYNKVRIAIYSIFLLGIAWSCKKDQNEPVKVVSVVVFNKPGDSHIYDNVKSLSKDAVDQIKEVSANGLIIENFESSDKQINVGDVIVADVSEKVPYGALRKVTKKENSAGRLKLETTNASLNEVIKYGKISIKESLGDTIASSKGARIQAGTTLKTNFSYTYDQDENPATKNDQVNFDMAGTMDPSFVFEWEKIENSVLPVYSRIAFEADVDLAATFYAAIDKITFGEKPVRKFTFPTIRIPVYGIIIVFKPEIEFYVSLDIPSPVDAKFGLQMKKKFVLGGSYYNGDWRGDDSNDLEAKLIPPLSFKDRATIKATFLHARLVVYPYGIKEMAAYAGGMFGSDIDLDCGAGLYKSNLWLRAELGLKYNFSFFNGFLQGGQDFNNTYDSFKKELQSGPLPCGAMGTLIIKADSIPRPGSIWYDHGFSVTVNTPILSSTPANGVVWFSVGPVDTNGDVGAMNITVLKAPSDFYFEGFSRKGNTIFFADNFWSKATQQWKLWLNSGIWSPNQSPTIQGVTGSKTVAFSLPFLARDNKGYSVTIPLIR